MAPVLAPRLLGYDRKSNFPTVSQKGIQVRSQKTSQAKFDDATVAHRQGKLAEAERIYADILLQQPGYFDALHRLGIIAAQRGQPERAVELFKRAIALNAHVGGIHRNLGHALLELGMLNDALLSYQRAIALSPDDAESYNGSGLALQDLKRFKESVKCFDRAITLIPDFAEAHYHRGLALQQLKRFDESLEAYDRAIVLKRDFAEAYSNRGAVLRYLERPVEALASYDRAIALKPRIAEGYLNRGNALRDLGRLDEALISFDDAIAIEPDFAAAYSNRGNVLKKLRRFDEALDSFDKSIAVKGDFAEAYCDRGSVLQELGRFGEALASFDKAIALKPDLAEAYNNKGNVLKDLGQLDEARSAYINSLHLDPDNTGVYLNVADSTTFAVGDPHLTTMELLAGKKLSKYRRIQLDFALGKAYSDLKEYRRSFAHFLAANAAKRAMISYDEKSVFDLFDRIQVLFTHELIAENSGGGYSSPMPIFVLGMPRSGTTLVEQIIASHPKVRGAGELQLLDGVLASVRGQNSAIMPFPEMALSLDASLLQDIGRRYVAALRARVPKGEHVTDKTPSNYYFAGLIHLALPNAKIIHTLRDPIDTCVSCFAHLFSEGQHHTYDLGEMGGYYRRYEQLMAHWRRVFPAGRILDVKYENVVADLESEARRIIQHCELPWDDRCLAFYKTERPVRTVSAVQVRQPIYKNAIGRWRAYEEFLEPLLLELGSIDRDRR